MPLTVATVGSSESTRLLLRLEPEASGGAEGSEEAEGLEELELKSLLWSLNVTRLFLGMRNRGAPKTFRMYTFSVWMRR